MKVLLDEIHLGTCFLGGTNFGNNVGYNYLNNTVLAAIFAKDNFDVLRLLWYFEFGAD